MQWLMAASCESDLKNIFQVKAYVQDKNQLLNSKDKKVSAKFDTRYIRS